MKKIKNKITYTKEFSSILLHAGLGLVFLALPVLSKLYATLFILFAFLMVIKTKNKNNEVLMICAYLAGSDVFFRMTHGVFLYEQTKYLIILFMIFGMLYKHLSGKALTYLLYLLLLVPGIFYSAFNVLDYDAEFRKIIAFNLSGPFTLGICAIYCVDRKVTFQQMKRILLWLLLPIISMTIYVTFYNVEVSTTFTNTASNFAVSGGYGPNQVSVVLGVGMLVLVIRYFTDSTTILSKVVNLTLLGYMSYRALITFSRGGVLTAIAAVIIFIGLLLLFTKGKTKISTIRQLTVFGVLLFGIWGYSNIVSNGLLEKRYNNQDALGREKQDALGGREELMGYEIQAFKENPIFGLGVGNNKFYREKTANIEAASHNEITRLLAEHGLFGILAFLILFFYPLYRFLNEHKNLFAMSFFVIWFLTINHNATRIAMPSFIYGLAVLTIVYEKKKNSIHRK